jgi:hypothetical protein
MDKRTLVVGVHGVVALGLVAFGAYRASRGAVVPGVLNVVTAGAIVLVGWYIADLA